MTGPITSTGQLGTTALPPRGSNPDVPALATQILNDALIGSRRGSDHRTLSHNLNAVEVALDNIKMSDPALADAVRGAVRSQLNVVEAGQLARLEPGRMVPLGGREYLNYADKNGISQAEWITQNRQSNSVKYQEVAKLAGSNDDAAIGRVLDELYRTGMTPEQLGTARLNEASLASSETLQDLGQMALDIVGIFDPTPTADLVNAGWSAWRGDGWGAFLSVVSAVPYIGDAAKLGKLGKWAETTAKAIDMAANNPAMKAMLEPSLKKISDLIGSLPAAALDSLPASAKAELLAMKGKIDDLLGVTGRKVDDLKSLMSRYPELNSGTDIAIKSADDVNADFVAKGWQPPYAAGAKAAEFTTTTEMMFVRVHGPDNKARSWMMRPADIHGLSPQQIKDKFALPDLPTMVSDVTVPAGTRVRVGEVAAQDGWGKGGATQFELLARLPESAFANTKPLN
jgi:hypothetical protein